jgi:hypothetical protein
MSQDYLHRRQGQVALHQFNGPGPADRFRAAQFFDKPAGSGPGRIHGPFPEGLFQLMELAGSLGDLAGIPIRVIIGIICSFEKKMSGKKKSSTTSLKNEEIILVLFI